ncbi:MAG TPA: pitrilysin family protein [Pyrinomonadaceae bacterium]|nr:pitrilysin family protein [Pyrinomonadaceae bacterium]
MKKIFLSSLLILSTLTSVNFAQTAKAKQATTTTKPATTKQTAEVPFVNKVLPNGLEVIVLPDSSVPIVTVELAVRNGSFTEPPELNGLSHLYEHMFFKPNQANLLYQCELALNAGGLNDYGRRICAEPLKLKSQIGSLTYLANADQLSIHNGTTREEVVNYYYTTTSPYLGSAIRLINDAVRYPTFDEQELKEEIQVVIGEIDRNESNPFFYLSRTLMDKLYYKYPTRKNALGSRASVLAATTEKMRTIQSRYYVPNNAALVVTGDVKPEEVFRLAEESFGSWKRREVDPFKDFPLVEHPALLKSEGFIVEQPIQNVLINIGWHGPSIGKDDAATYAADVFSYILSQPNSRFQRAMVDSGLTVGADINYYTQRNVGPIQLLLVTTPDKAKAALKAAYAEIAQFDKPDYFTDEELESAKTILESRDLFEREKLSEYAHTLGFWWSSTGIDYFRGYHKNLRATSRSEINRYVKTYIQGKPHVGVALISPQAQMQAKITPEDLIGK